ncbi:basic proline-rich protein-like [Pyrgilauda ruficollis]|uniref:basic proline-rich protein-like n=1 Tax=Pyrgilauda ruficollis TaxID=221976 RepID=UPI001B86EC2F|nr:basic proline-rich protein-like [Pyrgilauda ruficollis]
MGVGSGRRCGPDAAPPAPGAVAPAASPKPRPGAGGRSAGAPSRRPPLPPPPKLARTSVPISCCYMHRLRRRGGRDGRVRGGPLPHPGRTSGESAQLNRKPASYSLPLPAPPAPCPRRRQNTHSRVCALTHTAGTPGPAPGSPPRPARGAGGGDRRRPPPPHAARSGAGATENTNSLLRAGRGLRTRGPTAHSTGISRQPPPLAASDQKTLFRTPLRCALPPRSPHFSPSFSLCEQRAGAAEGGLGWQRAPSLRSAPSPPGAHTHTRAPPPSPPAARPRHPHHIVPNSTAVPRKCH